MLKQLGAAIIILITSNCSMITSPTPFGIYRGLGGDAPDGTETWRQGWKDGCKSGIAAYGPLHYKFMYDYTYKASLIDNQEYHEAWQGGFRHCRWYTSSWTR